MPGYSGTPLAKKLGFKEGCRFRISGAPANYRKLVSPTPQNVTISERISANIDIWHFFTKSYAELESKLPALMKAEVGYSERAAQIAPD
jgi:hypothetical protein